MRGWRPGAVLFWAAVLVSENVLILTTLCGEWSSFAGLGVCVSTKWRVVVKRSSATLGTQASTPTETITTSTRAQPVPKPSITPWTQRAFIINPHLLVAIVVFHAADHEKIPRFGRCFLGNVDGFLSRNSSQSYWLEAYGHQHQAMAAYCEFREAVLDRGKHGGWRVALDFKKPSPFLTNAVIEVDSRPAKTSAFNVTVCLPSLFGSLRWKWIEEWLHFYRVKLRVEHFFVYSALPDLRNTPLSKGLMGNDIDIIDIVTAVREFDMYYYGQSIAVCDCLFLNNWLGTKWTIFQDFDEVLWLPDPWTSTLEFLSDHGAGKDVVTLVIGMSTSEHAKSLEEGT